MIVSLHPLAEAEFVDAASYYAMQGSVEVGRQFVGEFERSIDLLRDHPALGAAWTTPFRRLPMRRFPYSIVYVTSGTQLRVIALAHQRRKPGYWLDRLGEP